VFQRGICKSQPGFTVAEDYALLSIILVILQIICNKYNIIPIVKILLILLLYQGGILN
jgi:hypothetical protein